MKVGLKNKKESLAISNEIAKTLVKELRDKCEAKIRPLVNQIKVSKEVILTNLKFGDYEKASELSYKSISWRRQVQYLYDVMNAFDFLQDYDLVRKVKKGDFFPVEIGIVLFHLKKVEKFYKAKELSNILIRLIPKDKQQEFQTNPELYVEDTIKLMRGNPSIEEVVQYSKEIINSYKLAKELEIKKETEMLRKFKKLKEQSKNIDKTKDSDKTLLSINVTTTAEKELKASKDKPETESMANEYQGTVDIKENTNDLSNIMMKEAMTQDALQNDHIKKIEAVQRGEMDILEFMQNIFKEEL